MSLKQFAAAGLVLAAVASFAQMTTPLDPDWREIEVPPPPPLRTERLIPLELPGMALQFGVDPASISVGEDGIVRYVVVARSPSGVINANYEGIHCQMANVKVYARHNADSGWVRTRDPQWVPIHTTPNSRHSLLIARGGACMGHGPNVSPSRIARDLASPADARFRN